MWFFVKGDQLYVSMFRWTCPEDLLPARFNPPDPRVSSYGDALRSSA